MDRRRRELAAIALCARFGHDANSSDEVARLVRSSSPAAQAVLLDAVSLLPDAERVVLIARYGLAGGPPCTLGLAADALGVSRERIRILEKRALESLIPRWNIVAPGSEPILLAAN